MQELAPRQAGDPGLGEGQLEFPAVHFGATGRLAPLTWVLQPDGRPAGPGVAGLGSSREEARDGHSRVPHARRVMQTTCCQHRAVCARSMAVPKAR